MPRTPANEQQAAAADSVDAEVTKGPGDPTQGTEPPTGAGTGQTNVTTSAMLESGANPTVVGAGTQPSGSSSPAGSSGTSSSGSSAPAGAASSAPAGAASSDSSSARLTVHTITTTQVGVMPTDPHVALSNLKGEANTLQRLMSNVTHMATLPAREIEKAIAKMSALLGVIRANL